MKRVHYLFLVMVLTIGITKTKAQQITISNDSLIIAKNYADTLKSINLSGFGLTTIPINLTDFSSLTKIDLSHNKLEQLNGLEQLKNLRVLILDHNPQLKGSSLNNTLPGINNLKVLSIQYSNLLFVPYAVYNQIGLEELNLSGNDIDAISSEIGKLKLLRSLYLDNNNIEFIDNGVQHLRKLEVLSISSNPILNRAHLFLQLSQLNRLKELAIDGGSVEEGYTRDNLINSVEKLTISANNNTTNQTLVKLFPTLKSLTIKGDLTEEGMENLLSNIRADSLKELAIMNASLENLPNSILKCRELSRLTLLTNSLESLPISINRLGELKYLFIGSDQLNINELTTRLIPLKGLKELKVEMTDLSQLSKQLTQVNNLERVELVTESEEIENLDYLKDEMQDCEFIVNSESDTKSEEGLSPPLTVVDVAFDEYLVDADKGEQIVTPSGTEIIIPKNAFLDENGDIVKGDVTIEYREFRDPIDMAFAGVPMTEKEDGETFTYSSAGMMQFRVKKNNKELQPNPDSLITVNYNSPFEGDEYDLYYLDPEQEAWQNIGKDSLIDLDSVPERHQRVMPEPNPPVQPNYPTFPYRKDKLSLCINDREKRKTTYIDLRSNSRKRWSRRDTNNKVFSELRYFSKVKWKVDYNTKKYKEGNDSIKALITRINQYNRQSNALSNRVSRSRFVWGGLNFFHDYWIEPNEENDNFNLVLSLSSETYKIPIVPSKLPKRVENAQRKMKQVYTSINKNLEKRKSDWEKVDRNKAKAVVAYQNEMALYQDKMDDYRNSMGEYNRAELERLNTYAASEENIIRSFNLYSFGVFNCDIIFRMENPEPLLAQLKDEKGNRLSIKTLYVLDRETNGLLTFNQPKKAVYDFYHTNSIIAILGNEKVAVLKSKDFEAKPMNRTSTEVILKTYDMKNTSISELKKYGDFF